MSWKPEVIADNSGKWAGNDLRFATREEAEANVTALGMRWTSVRDMRVVECEDPVNYRWVGGRLQRIEAIEMKGSHEMKTPRMPPRRDWHASLTDDRIIDAVERRMTSLDDPGFCLACGLEAYGVEPDARGYECESCGAPMVYGADELALRIP